MSKLSELKLRFYEMIAEAARQKEPINYKMASQELGVDSSKLLVWVKELNNSSSDKVVSELLDDDVMANKVTTAILEDVTTLDNVVINPVTGIIEVQQPNGEVKSTGMTRRKVSTFRAKVSDLKTLSEELQSTARALVEQIDIQLEEQQDISCVDIKNLAASLASIQNAFFNRPTTNIQVNNVDGEGLLGMFKKEQKA